MLTKEGTQLIPDGFEKEKKRKKRGRIIRLNRVLSKLKLGSKRQVKESSLTPPAGKKSEGISDRTEQLGATPFESFHHVVYFSCLKKKN